MEAAWSLGLALLLLMIMTVMVMQQNKAEMKLSLIRSASRATETALLELKAGKPLPAGFQLEKLPDKAPQGYAWVRVTGQSNGNERTEKVYRERCSLVGLTPSEPRPSGSDPGGAR